MNDASSGQTPHYALKDALICAACGIAGLLLAFAGIYLGTGWLDGFSDWDLHRLGRRLRASLVWSLPVAASCGLLLYDYYRHALAQRAKIWISMIGVVRAFMLFPLLGFGLLLSFFLSLGIGVVSRLAHKLFRLPLVADGLLERLLGPLLWTLTLPFSLLGVQSEGDMRIPSRVSRKRLLRWLPFLLVILVFWCGAVSEETDERVNPYWLAAFAAYWFIDYLVVVFYVAPTLGRRSQKQSSGGTSSG